MVKRIITGAGIVVVVAAFFLFRVFFNDVLFVSTYYDVSTEITVGSLLFDLFILAIAWISTYEYARAFKDKIITSEKVVVLAYPIVVYLAFMFKGLGWAFGAMLGAFLCLLSLLVIDYKKITLESIGWSLFAMVYPSTVLVSLLVLNRAYPNEIGPLLLPFVISPFADTFAFFVGSAVGGKKMCPEISPKKTISGAIGGLVGGLIGSLAVFFVFIDKGAYSSLASGIILFALAGVLGALLTEFGDLIESVVKRKLGLKDMGNILPGHGGMSDRIDGLAFTAPAVALVFVIILPIFI